MENKNRLIAAFMGYEYYHPGVIDEFSEWAGETKEEIFSKVPIEVNEYPEDNECYFKNIPNPDFGNKVNPHFRNDFEYLSWTTVNSMKYIIQPKYDSSYDWIIPVYIKAKSDISEKYKELIDGAGVFILEGKIREAYDRLAGTIFLRNLDNEREKLNRQIL